MRDGSGTRTPSVIVCDWAAQAFLRAEGGGAGRTARTAWCFLSELESSGVPSKVADYMRDTTHSALETRAEANVQLRSGHLSIHKEMLDACDAMAAGRSQLMDRFLVSTPHCRALREAWRASQEQRASQAGERAAAVESLARRVASALRRDHHAIVDDFLPAPLASAGVGAELREMHADGGLKAGQVSAGLHEQQRSDLMAWLPAAAELQPAQIGQLLHALDRLMLALCEMPQLSEDLGGVALLRGEAQCTVYPGGGSRYIRHTDDARKQVRKLTAILYANPGWSAEAGGELRLHLRRPDGHSFAKDVAPLDNRLVVFWSDARVPHEVLPSHALRYAVSVWYHDQRGVHKEGASGA